MKLYQTTGEHKRDGRLNLGQPHYEAAVWSRDAELGSNGAVVRGNLLATFSYYPRTGTFYLTRNGPRGKDEFTYDDRFDAPLTHYLNRLAHYTNSGYRVLARMSYVWGPK